MRIKTGKVFYKRLNNSETNEVKFVGPRYFYTGQTIPYLMEKWNTGCTMRNKLKILVT